MEVGRGWIFFGGIEFFHGPSRPLDYKISIGQDLFRKVPACLFSTVRYVGRSLLQICRRFSLRGISVLVRGGRTDQDNFEGYWGDIVVLRSRTEVAHFLLFSRE